MSKKLRSVGRAERDVTERAVRAYNEASKAPGRGVPGGEEITLPSSIQELLEGLQEELVSDAPVVSLWRPDEVRKNRKLKQQAYWLKRKASMKKRMGRPLKWKTGWQKRKAPKDRRWKYYNGTIGGDAWKKYSLIWKNNKVEVRITPEEWDEIVQKCGGLHKIRRVTCYQKVASKDTITVYAHYVGYKTKKKIKAGTKILYRGTLVPERDD